MTSVAREPHVNLFFAYRGPSPSDEAATRQLEDNLTRALIVTLRTVQDRHARRALLRALSIDEDALDQPPRVALQVRAPGDDWPPRHRRRLLVIHGGPALTIATGTSPTVTGRADAVVIAGDSLVAIESKLANVVERAQLDRHCTTLGIPPDAIVDVNWSTLARVMHSLRVSESVDAVGAYLIRQLGEYLMLNGFGTLSESHFAYFAVPVDDRDSSVKDGIRRILGDLGVTVAAMIGTPWTPHVLNITPRSTDAGVVLEPGERGRAPHLTIGLDPSGMTIFGNVELEPSYRVFVRALASAPEQFVGIVRALGGQVVRTAADLPWEFRVVRRVPLSQPRQYHYWTSFTAAAPVLASWPDETIVDLIRRAIEKPAGEAAPEIVLARRYPASMLIRNERVAELLAADARALEPYFAWLGVPMRPPAG